jgi:hypothetical protein
MDLFKLASDAIHTIPDHIQHDLLRWVGIDSAIAAMWSPGHCEVKPYWCIWINTKQAEKALDAVSIVVYDSPRQDEPWPVLLSLSMLAKGNT